MFEDKRYHVAGPTGGPGVLGPWHPVGDSAVAQTRHRRKQARNLLWSRITGRVTAA